MSYETLTHFAESWAMAAMAVLFVGFCFWAYRPGAAKTYERAARSLFDGQDGEV